MSKYVRCKVCGYIAKEGEIKDSCPACGAFAKAFEPYELTISEKRKRILDLHIHPIIVHFPQAYIPTMIIFLIVKLFLTEQSTPWDVIIKVGLIIQTASIIGAFLTGIYDGKTRYKKIKTPFLKRKITFGSFVLLTSISCVLISFFTELSNIVPLLIMLVLHVLMVGGIGILGLTGGKLTSAVTKGK